MAPAAKPPTKRSRSMRSPRRKPCVRAETPTCSPASPATDVSASAKGAAIHPSENARFVGAAPHQVDAFLAEVKPLAKKHKGAAEYRPGRLL